MSGSGIAIDVVVMLAVVVCLVRYSSAEGR